MFRSRLPVVLAPYAAPAFPNPELADGRGLIAAGGALTPEWLRAAYDSGIFPWYDEGMPPLWWSPDPRTVMDASKLHVSRSMRRSLRSQGFELRFDSDFEGVMRGCAAEREDGTWILPEMIDAYVTLFRLGEAHSVEVYGQGTLVGGLYGVQRGALFAAESMFHRATNASKVALIVAVQSLFAAGIELFDVQFATPHLTSLGAYSIRRSEYLARLKVATARKVSLSSLALGADV